ncbi:MAG: class I SAM-dependent methyltransferase [Bacteroidota bacterium]
MDNKEIYEKFDWGALKQEHLIEKIKKILDVIPPDIKTVVDIGCGNGIITNVLNQQYKVTAVDRSEQALKFVKAKKINASCDNIPLKDNSFDMVFSSELLEHLPDDVLEGTISEFKRLSNKYIFITVPNDENPDKLSIVCPKCSYRYNSPNHLRSFNTTKLSALFPEYKLINTFTFGRKIRYYNRNILKLKTSLSPSNSWIPYYWMSKEKRETTCPSCENTFINPYKFNLLSLGCDLLNIAVSPKKPYWLFAVFEKV